MSTARSAPTRRRTGVVAVAALLVSTGLLAGCGGGSDPADSPATDSPPPDSPPTDSLSAEEFAATGNEICRRYDQSQQEVEQQVAGEDGQIDSAGLARLGQLNEEFARELLALEPPSEHRDDWDRLREIRAEVSDSRIPEPDVGQRLRPEVEEIMGRLGLTDCA